MSPDSEDTTHSVNQESLDIILSETKGKLAAQERRIHSLDVKANVFIGLDVAVLAIIAGIPTTHGVAPYLRILAFAFLLLGVLCLVRGLWARKWKFPPNPRKLLDGCLSWPAANTKMLLVKTMANAYETNVRRLRQKTGWMKAGFAAIVIGVFSYALLLLVQATPHH